MRVYKGKGSNDGNIADIIEQRYIYAL